jgi:dienelactone hydrolase
MRGAIACSILSAALLTFACSGSGRQPDLPVDSAYQIAPGPLKIITVNRTTLDFPALDKELQMRLAFPARGGPYPVIIFSHGNGCSQDMYAGFADHWASFGFVVIQPVHMDSMDLGFSMKGVTLEIMNKVVSDRPKDVQFILDSFDHLEAQVPELSGKIDATRMVAAGHSMGAGTAMMLNGVAMTNPVDQFTLKTDESRFQALILISEPGNNRIMPDAPWRMSKVPTLIVTGSNDFSTTGAPDGKKRKNAWFIPDNAVYPDQPHYYLYMDGSDHYFGGVICRDDRPGPRDYGALNISNGVTTAFLNAYMKGDEVAMRFIGSDHVTALSNGRATLEIR